MAYIENIKGFVFTFPSWQQTAIFVGGIVFICIIQRIGKKLRTRRFKIDDGRRSMIVIESRNRKKKKKDVNTLYFEYIKNAQYSTQSRSRWEAMNESD